MPDLTMASAMPLIMSSLTLQANLFQEFQRMGGVRARALDVGLFSCAGRAATRRRMPKHTTTTSLLIFMRCFYQKNLDVCRKMFARTKRTGRDETAQAVTNRFTILPCR